MTLTPVTRTTGDNGRLVGQLAAALQARHLLSWQPDSRIIDLTYELTLLAEAAKVKSPAPVRDIGYIDEGGVQRYEAGQTNDISRCVARLEQLLYTHQIQLARGGAGEDLRRAIDLLKSQACA